jgi:hypothetical protein
MQRRQQTGGAVEAAGHIKDVGEEEMIQRWQGSGLGRRRDGRTRRLKEAVLGIIGV